MWMSTCLVFAFASLIEFAIVNVWSRREARRAKNADMMSLKRALHNTLPQPTTTTTTTTTTTPAATATVGSRPQKQRIRVCTACQKAAVDPPVKHNLLTVPQPTITTTIVADDSDKQDDDIQNEPHQQQVRCGGGGLREGRLKLEEWTTMNEGEQDCTLTDRQLKDRKFLYSVIR